MTKTDKWKRERDFSAQGYPRCQKCNFKGSTVKEYNNLGVLCLSCWLFKIHDLKKKLDNQPLHNPSYFGKAII
jgi:hypothetical protein